MIDLLTCERVDGFRWQPPEEQHGHENDCLRVYRDGDFAYKTVIRNLDNGRHQKTLKDAWEILSLLNHPNLIHALEWIETKMYVAVKMPYYNTMLEDVFVHMKARDRAGVREQVTDVVHYLYENNVVHGDLVLKNFFYDRELRKPILFDFQTAQVIMQSCSFEESLDVIGEMKHNSCCGSFWSVNLRHLLDYDIPC